MSGPTPRAVIVRRSTEYELLLARHATRGQAVFFLSTRGQSIDRVQQEHEQIHSAMTTLTGAIPAKWRRAEINRTDLDRFLFEPDDLLLAVGQDGLVANIAKYLRGQPVLGVNPLPRVYDGVLSPFDAREACEILSKIARGATPQIQHRTMAQATLDDGQSLLALNEIFVGHRSHQSARYHLQSSQAEERHSSSGVIISTGTGATGWARSINMGRSEPLTLPTPTQRSLTYFVREAFPSVSTGTEICGGTIGGDGTITITSEMNEGGVIFGDGIEQDRLDFAWGQRLRVGVAKQTLNLITG